MSHLYQEEDKWYENERWKSLNGKKTISTQGTGEEFSSKEILNRKMFYYNFLHILSNLFFCLKCWVKKKNLSKLKNSLLRREKLYNLAEERLNKDLDVINLVWQIWKFEILS